MAKLFVTKDGKVRAIRNDGRPMPATGQPSSLTSTTALQGEQSVSLEVDLPDSFFEDRLAIKMTVPDGTVTSSGEKKAQFTYDGANGETKWT
tara:strand:- start:12687 stop:12962 length:276 start_codon:yes stop_codon:yes gene_type:complete